MSNWRTPLHWTIADRLQRGGHHVALLGQGAGEPEGRSDAVLHDMSPTHPNAMQVMRAGHYDAIVFFYAFESTQTSAQDAVHGGLLDALFQFQMYAQQLDISHLMLVTDARVFGQGQDASELTSPVPDTPGGILIKAAEDCLRFNGQDRINTLLVRVTNLYDEHTPPTLFEQVRACAQHQRPLLLPGTPDSPVDYLHADDFARFLLDALAQGMSGAAHLAYSATRTNADAVGLWHTLYPDLTIEYTQEPSRSPLLAVKRAEAELNWIPRHDWFDDAQSFLQAGPRRERRPAWQRVKGWVRGHFRGKAMPWIELVLLAVLSQYLSDMTERYALFRFIDFWLFYVILIGSMHGTFFGVSAAVVACVAYALDWIMSGNDAYLLLINVDNWLPFVMYLLAGGVFGYIRQGMQARIDLLTREKEESEEAAAFVQTMYQQAYEDRNRLQEQVMRSRDSYGRIYAIARELDTLQPEQVFLSTLGVLEDTLQNQSVALYSCTQDSPFIRLVVYSRALGNRLDKSLDLRKLPLLQAQMDTGEVFVNTALDAGYPSFAAPVRRDGKAVALIVLWDVPFEKQTLYHRNLFNVVVGLVQSSMIRALQYFGTAGDVYIDGTILLTDKAFRAATAVYRSMRKKKAASFLLLRVESTEPGLSDIEMSDRMRKATRSTDILGRLDNGIYYALLPQAGVENLPQIDGRFHGVGLVQTVAALESIHE